MPLVAVQNVPEHQNSSTLLFLWSIRSLNGVIAKKCVPGSCSIMPVSCYNPGLEIMEPWSTWDRPGEGEDWTQKGTGHLTFIQLCLSQYNQSSYHLPQYRQSYRLSVIVPSLTSPVRKTARLIMLYHKLKNNIYVRGSKPLG